MLLISSNTGLHSARKGKPRFSMIEAVSFFGKAGFEALDVNFAGTIYPQEEAHEPILDGDWKKNLDGLCAAMQENGLAVSHTHLPFYDYTMEDQETLAFNEAMMYRAIEASAYIGAKLAVIHPKRDESKRTLIDETIALLTPYKNAANKVGVTLCVENMGSTTAQELCEIVDGLSCFACWDCGHGNLCGLSQYDAIIALNDRLRVLHLHDNYGIKDEHTLPFFGTVDWEGLMRGLRAIKYQGTFNYEVAAKAVPEVLRMDHAKYLMNAAKYILELPC